MFQVNWSNAECECVLKLLDLVEFFYIAYVIVNIIDNNNTED